MTSGVTRCPACGSAEATAVGAAAKGFDSDEGGRRYRQPDYAIRHCGNCGLYFKSHTIELAVLADYYQRHDEGIYESGHRYPTDRLLDDYIARLPDGSRILDFGCSTGRMLKGVSSRLDCYGVEPNHRAAALARDRGIQIVSESDLATWPRDGFDAIILADVYEHLPQPVELFGRLCRLLKPGGWLAVVTGNADAIDDRDLIAEFWYFRTPAHLLMLSERHVHWLAGRFHLELTAVHRCSHYDRPLRERIGQRARSAAYAWQRSRQRGPWARLLRTLPVIGRAAGWSNAPRLDSTADHIVAVFRRPAAVPPLEGIQ